MARLHRAHTKTRGHACWSADRWSFCSRSNEAQVTHDRPMSRHRGRLRVEPAGLARVHQTLIDAGFGQVLPSADGIAHRYTRSGATIDVLAPDRLGSRARLALGGGRTIEAPGGSQALVRSSVVKVELTDGSTARASSNLGRRAPRQGRRGDADRCPDLGRTSEARARCRLTRALARPDGSRTGAPHP